MGTDEVFYSNRRTENPKQELTHRGSEGKVWRNYGGTKTFDGLQEKKKNRKDYRKFNKNETETI